MPYRVLVVDDDTEVREMMAEWLTLEGFEATVACDGHDALEKLRNGAPRPHVIVLDLMMPRMDGWTFRRLQHADPALSGIPVVIMSAAPREQLEKVDAAAVVPKPCDYDRLLSALRACC
jgi:two-component system response regulator MprA